MCCCCYGCCCRTLCQLQHHVAGRLRLLMSALGPWRHRCQVSARIWPAGCQITPASVRVHHSALHKMLCMLLSVCWSSACCRFQQHMRGSWTCQRYMLQSRNANKVLWLPAVCLTAGFQAFADPDTGAVTAVDADISFNSNSVVLVVVGRGPLGAFTARVSAVQLEGVCPVSPFVWDWGCRWLQQHMG